MSTLFDPIPQLKLSDTFYNWWEVTNEISAALNPLNIYDVSAGYGITLSRLEGNVTISVLAGCGLKFDGNYLTLDIREATEDINGPNSSDFYIFERSIGSTDQYPNTTDGSDCETLRKVRADQVLPSTVQGNHTFNGSITVDNAFTAGASSGLSTMRFRSNAIRLGSPTGSKSNISSIGFFIDTNDDDPNWVFRGDISGWYTNQNIGISYDQAFVCDAPVGLNVAKFNFAPVTGQDNTQLNLLLGDRTADGITTTDTDESISFTALQATKSISVEYIETNGQKTTLFTGSNAGGSNVFTVGGKIFITDIQNSSQFSTQSDYSIYKVPLTNTNGILDYRFTNRLVATNYSAIVGDVVRFDGTNYVAAQANNETNSRVVGIVERIDGGKATIALSGVFTSSSLTAGNVYYLDQSTAGAVTTTKPTSGLIKEVYVGLTTTTGMLFSSAISSGPTFANVQITGDDLVTADVSGDTLVLTAGNNISIERNTNNEILISAGTLSEANYFSTISPDVGTITAATANDTLVVTGERGILTYRNSSNELVIRGGRSFSTVEILGQNTNELDYTVQAVTGEDTLYLRSGVGINIVSSTDNDILIEATGVSIPADESITNAKLADMPAFSIKGAQANGRPTDIYVINPADELSSGNYTVTPGVGLNPTTYTDNITGVPYASIQSISGNYLLAEAPHEDVAGYVYGRWTDESGNVSNIIPLRRTELRSIIGASLDGFLEENSNLFNSWYLYDNGVGTTATDSQNADGKSGELVFIAGDNISLTKVATGAPDNKPYGIKIDASGNLGFNRIVNNRTGIDMLSGETSGVIEITDNGSISVNVDTNNGLTFDIKPESVTNEMLANMPFNSIKASVYNTDEPNPIDLVLNTNTIVGRGSGNLKALTPTEVRQILGLSSSQYFKTLKIENSGSTVTATVNASDSPDQEFFSLRAGSNITLSKIPGTNTITISSLGSSSGGLNTVTVSDIGNDTVTANDLTALNFKLLNLSPPTGFGSTVNYTNIDYIPTGPTLNVLGLSLDLALMPQYSVKVASNTPTDRHGASGYPAANLILTNNQVLCRVSNENSLVGRTVEQLASGGGGIPYLSKIGTNTLTPGPKTLDITAGNNCTVILSKSGDDLEYTIDCFTTLLTDTSPTLGANLNVNKKTFIGPSSVTLNPPSGNRTIAEFVQNRASGTSSGSAYFKFNTANATDAAVISLIEERLSGESLVGNKDITITPLGTGGRVNITNGIISTAAANSSFTINSTRNVASSGNATDLLNQHIYLLSGTTNDVSIGTLGTANTGKNLNFYASQIGTNNLGSKDITFVYTKNSTGGATTPSQIDRLITRGNDNSIGIFTTNTSGNLILAAGASAGTAGVIPSAGSSSIQFNSDLLLSGKSIKAANNNITIDTNTNDYNGALVVKATNKSGFHRVKSGTRNNNTTTEIDRLPTSNATEKANKYMLYMQDTGTSSTCAIVEFTVLANNSTYALKINSIIKNGIGETTFVELKTSTTLSGSPVDETGLNPTPTPDPGQICGTFTTTPDSLSVVIDPCLNGTFNYTLYKMSIQA